MNARKKIKKLKSENRFLREIIKDHAEMERIYHLWTDGLKLRTERKYPTCLKVSRIYPKNALDNPQNLEYAKRSMIRDCSMRLEDVMKWTKYSISDFVQIDGELMVIDLKEKEDERKSEVKPND